MEGKQNSTLLKRILLGIVIFALVVPAIQHKLRIVKVKPLNGAIKDVQKPSLSAKTWFNATFQDSTTDYLNQKVGFRNVMVRTYNQGHFSLFNRARANGVIVGKENYLYEENYIRAYYGEDFRGEEEIRTQIKKLKRVSDTLEKLGKHIVVMLAPGKASFFPEYIPRGPKKTGPMGIALRTNLDVYDQYLSNISMINLNSLFIEKKGKMKHPLFPKTGIHWSKYGEMVMADTLITYLNQLDGISVPNVIVDSFNVTDDAWDTDDDIEQGMNLLFNIPDNVMGYPYFRTAKDSTKSYSKVMTVADSYYWGPFNWGMSRDVFSGGQFWYYNEAIYPDSYEAPTFVKDIDFQKRVEENDVILIICTDANLFKFGFGFVEQAYDTYYKSE